SSREIRARRFPTTCFMRSNAAGYCAPRSSMRARIYSPRVSAGSVDMFQNTQTLGLYRSCSDVTGADECAGQFVNESVAADNGVRRHQLRCRPRLKRYREPVHTVVDAYIEPVRKPGLRSVLMKRGHRTWQSSRRLLKLAGVLHAHAIAAKCPADFAN